MCKEGRFRTPRWVDCTGLGLRPRCVPAVRPFAEIRGTGEEPSALRSLAETNPTQDDVPEGRVAVDVFSIKVQKNSMRRQSGRSPGDLNPNIEGDNKPGLGSMTRRSLAEGGINVSFIHGADRTQRGIQAEHPEHHHCNAGGG